jgi:hypothetical protein
MKGKTMHGDDKVNRPVARGLAILELFVGTGAVLGGGALVAAPSGTLLHMPLDVLRGTPFENYLIPGAVLCLVVGGSNILAGLLALRRNRAAVVSAFIAGGLLVVGFSHR